MTSTNMCWIRPNPKRGQQARLQHGIPSPASACCAHDQVEDSGYALNGGIPAGYIGAGAMLANAFTLVSATTPSDGAYFWTFQLDASIYPSTEVAGGPFTGRSHNITATNITTAVGAAVYSLPGVYRAVIRIYNGTSKNEGALPLHTHRIPVTVRALSLLSLASTSCETCGNYQDYVASIGTECGTTLTP